ncbi:MAG: cobalt-precorrin-5B (C(1))-methyltransferase [Alphaproteobacteria bacterium]
MARKPSGPLRRGWTTGACATAATRAAYTALLTGEFPDPVTITLPRGQETAFALAREATGDGWARAAIVKDAGDDPDVTHGALVAVTVRHGDAAGGVRFSAGAGVGTVTKPGLPISPGEPAINPVPRQMMCAVVQQVAAAHGATGGVDIEISISDGERLATRTMNGRLGIVGGLSVLGTTGIVVPYSCASWIASIRQGIDVARAAGYTHLAAGTGSTSEAAVQARYDLPEDALIDMGDFAGGLLKYLRDHPVDKLSIAGGFAKLTKLGCGDLDLHSGRSEVDFAWLAGQLAELGADPGLCDAARDANSALEVLQRATTKGLPIADAVARAARATAREVLGDATTIAVEVLVFDRAGALVGRSDH